MIEIPRQIRSLQHEELDESVSRWLWQRL